MHLWRADLHCAPEQSAACAALLSPDEAARADGYRFAKDRCRFIAARGFLRTLLGLYLHQLPQSLRFHYGPCGKPALAPETSQNALHFNLSHAEDLALIAVTGVAGVGVDIERIDAYPQEVAERFFARSELDWLHEAPEPDRSERFFQLWTRKEAVLKAQGVGLSGGLAACELPGAAECRGLDIGLGYAAAVALCEPFPPVKAWHWETGTAFPTDMI